VTPTRLYDLETGSLAYQPYMADWRVGRVTLRRLADVVTASSAFRQFIPLPFSKQTRTIY